MKCKDFMKDRILKAVGIDILAKDVKVEWEKFLEIQYILDVKCADKEK